MSDALPDGRDAFPEGFEDDLLLALACMAGRSHRGQADVHAAMNGACLVPAHTGHIARSLEALERGGFIEDVLPLSDGGILVRVTPAGKTRARVLLARRRVPVPPHPGAR